MSGWWTLSVPDQHGGNDELVQALENHDYVDAVEVGVDHIWALVRDPGGPVRMRDVLDDTFELWDAPRAAWGHANDTGMKGDVEIYGRRRNSPDISIEGEFAENDQGWQGRKAEAWALLNYNIDARIDWWHHFD